jgi:hypothetical protein
MRSWRATVRPHWIEIVLAAAVVVVGVAQVYIFIRQAEIMSTQAEIAKGQLDIYKRQAEIMSTQAEIAEVQQRPWIEIAPAADQDVIFDESGNFKGRFTIKGINIGKSPAVEARAAVIILPEVGPAPFPVHKYQEQSCLSAENDEMVMFGDESIDALPSKQQQGQDQTPTVFPNKNFSTGWNFDKTSSRFISHAVVGRPELKMLSALFTGCIVYRLSTFSKKWHHTQFAFEITTAKGIGLPFCPYL